MSVVLGVDRFRAGVKDLEVMVQNLISSAFETVCTVQEGVEILDIFHHLSTREVRRCLLPAISSASEPVVIEANISNF